MLIRMFLSSRWPRKSVEVNCAPWSMLKPLALFKWMSFPEEFAINLQLKITYRENVVHASPILADQ